MATGRSDYPNQVNNVLGFPYVFRGALDVRASVINEEMKMAAAQALADLAREYVPESVLEAYDLRKLKFGRDYIIPKPNDYRALEWVAAAVAEAAMRTGVARKQLDPTAYRAQLAGSQRRGWRVMARIVALAHADPKRIVFVEGEHPKILRAVQQIERTDVAVPILLGQPEIVRAQISELGLSCNPEVIRVEDSPHLETFAREIYRLRQRKGVTLDRARELARSPNVFGLMMVKMGEADTFLSGLTYDYPSVIRPALQLIGTLPGVSTVAGVFMVINQHEAYFLSDGAGNSSPDSSALAEIAILTADSASELGIEPRIGMLSFSNFGAVNHAETLKVRQAVTYVQERRPELCVDGEMQADVALSRRVIEERFPFSALRDANVLIFPNLDAANSSYKLLSQLGEADVVGPVLVGMNKSVHALQPSADLREVLRMTALAVVGAQKSR